MDKTRWSLIGIAVASIFSIIILLGYSEIVGAKSKGAQQKCAIVNIFGDNTPDPGTLKIAKGDCVVWQNWGSFAQVVVSGGENSKEMTKAEVGFKMDSKGRYITDYFAHYETASLLFPKAGTYNYEVRFKPLRGAVGPGEQFVSYTTSGSIVVE